MSLSRRVGSNSDSLAIFAAIRRLLIEGLEHDLDQRRVFEGIDNVWNAPDWVFVERKLMNIPRWVEWWPLAIFLLLFAIVFVTVAFSKWRIK
jgi:hypothetical protein